MDILALILNLTFDALQPRDFRKAGSEAKVTNTSANNIILQTPYELSVHGCTIDLYSSSEKAIAALSHFATGATVYQHTGNAKKHVIAQSRTVVFNEREPLGSH